MPSAAGGGCVKLDRDGHSSQGCGRSGQGSLTGTQSRTLTTHCLTGTRGAQLILDKRGFRLGSGDVISTSGGLSPLCTEHHPSLGRGSFTSRPLVWPQPCLQAWLPRPIVGKILPPQQGERE